MARRICRISATSLLSISFLSDSLITFHSRPAAYQERILEMLVGDNHTIPIATAYFLRDVFGSKKIFHTARRISPRRLSFQLVEEL